MSSAVAVLTAMITPAVLISACGSMILSTSTRLGRVVDRVRALSDKLDQVAEKTSDEVRNTKERQAIIFAQLDKLTSRARILQRSMVSFYLGLEYDSRGDGFHLEANHESGPGGFSRATQTAFCTFSKSQVRTRTDVRG